MRSEVNAFHLPVGGKRNNFGHLPSLHDAEMPVHGFLRHIGIRESAVHMGDDFINLCRIDTANRYNPLHLKFARRNRAGLVRTQNIDAGERLDRLNFLHKGFFIGKTDDTDDKGDGRQKDEPFRYHPDDTGNRMDDGLGKDPLVVIAVFQSQFEGS